PGVRGESVQLTDMPGDQEIADSEKLEEKWNNFMAVRNEVLKELERARDEKVIGKSLEAGVTLYPDEETTKLLEGIDELDKLFIVSKVDVGGEKGNAPPEAHTYDRMAVAVRPADGETCARCWVVRTSVGEDQQHPAL